MILYGNMTGGGGNGNPADVKVGYLIGEKAKILPPMQYSWIQQPTVISFPQATTVYASFFGSATYAMDYVEIINLPKIESFIIYANYEPSYSPFYGNHGSHLKEVYLGNEADNPSFYLPSSFFASTTLQKIYTGAKWLGSGCFMGCSYLSEVSFPMVSQIYPYAFSGCTNKDFKNISLPNLTSGSYSTFVNCRYLTTIYAPKLSGYLRGGFISTCRNLKSLYLGDISYFEYSCLYYVNYESETSTDWKFDLYLKSVTQVPTLASTSFTAVFVQVSSWNNSSRFSIHVPSSLYSEFIVANGWKQASARITSD